MGDEKQAVMQHEVGRRHGQQHPGHPAERESHHEADRPEHRHLETDAAAVHVNSQLNTFTPVGIAMIIVITPKKPLTSAPAPIVKKWCSHTMKESMQIAIVATTIERQPKTGLPRTSQ